MSIMLMWDDNPTVVEYYFWVNKAATLGQNALSALFLLIFVERFFATLHRTTYEKTQHMCLLYFGIMLCWIFGVWNILAWNICE